MPQIKKNLPEKVKFNSTFTVRRCDDEGYQLSLIFAVFDVPVIACRR